VTTGNQGEGATEFVFLNTTRTLRTMAKRSRWGSFSVEDVNV
jgi:hypothetical protein